MLKEKSFAADLIFICVCAALAVLLGIGIFLLPHKSYSEEENRVLASPPRLSLSALAEGRYFEQISSFYSDHIPFRNKMIKAKAICELGLGKKQNNDVIFEKDGTLTARPEYADTELLRKNLSAMTAFAESCNAELVTVPRSIDITDRDFERQASIKELCDTTLAARLTDLNSQGKYPYYKTDHHLNDIGILALYERLSVTLGFSPEKFEEKQVSTDFKGSLYSRAGLINTASDKIILLRYDKDEALRVFCLDKGCEQCSLYSYERLDTKDKYTVFLGGNHGVLKVCSDTEKPELLIIKDSFANALIPLLARHFNITAVDPRYYKGSLTELEKSGEYDRVLLLFGIDTLATTAVSKSFIP